MLGKTIETFVATSDPAVVLQVEILKSELLQ
jgi:hypothetical protein